jgi:hypothetical protein
MFTKATFSFLDELAVNNHRAWFEANKPRYESIVREPALEFIAAMGPVLEQFAPHFRADPRKVPGYNGYPSNTGYPGNLPGNHTRGNRPGSAESAYGFGPDYGRGYSNAPLNDEIGGWISDWFSCAIIGKPQVTPQI